MSASAQDTANNILSGIVAIVLVGMVIIAVLGFASQIISDVIDGAKDVPWYGLVLLFIVPAGLIGLVAVSLGANFRISVIATIVGGAISFVALLAHQA